jgi:hypothetical protein
VFGGPDMHTLNATGGGTVYKHVLKRQGLPSLEHFQTAHASPLNQ